MNRRLWQIITLLFIFTLLGGTVSLILRQDAVGVPLLSASMLLGLILLLRLMLKRPLLFPVVAIVVGIIGGATTQNMMFFVLFFLGFLATILVALLAVFGVLPRNTKKQQPTPIDQFREAFGNDDQHLRIRDMP